MSLNGNLATALPVLALVLLLPVGEAFTTVRSTPPGPPLARPRSAAAAALHAAPKRFEDNADGVLYVNDKCINCAACSHFAPDVFARAPADGHHHVYHQPSADDADQLDRARAALSACPVAAIRVENSAKLNHASKAAGGAGEQLSSKDKELANMLAISPKLNGLDLPFPRPLLENVDTGAYFLGSHNDKSFGATPYLVKGKSHDGSIVSVMVDTPKFTPQSVRTVQSLAGESGPDYLFLTHVDDTAHHKKWREKFPSLKRIFHSGDLGPNNWLGDTTLEEVEVLLEGETDAHGKQIQAWNLDGESMDAVSFEGDSWPAEAKGNFIILHTPGHSPGSISLLYRSESGLAGILFTGDTYAYSTRDEGHMSGFPRYGNNLSLQMKILGKIGDTSGLWDVIAPGHGHTKEYISIEDVAAKAEAKYADVNAAVEELESYRRF